MRDDGLQDINFSFDPTFSCINVRYDINGIINKLIIESASDNIDNIKNIIRSQHELIFKQYNLANNNRTLIQKLFTEYSIAVKFLDSLEDVVGLLELSEEEIIFINKLTYDFFECTKRIHCANENTIKEKLLSITYKINAHRIRQLARYIGINNANILAIISYSSFIDEKIVHRVNDFVITNIRINDILDLMMVYDIMFQIIPNNNIDMNRKAQNYIIYSMLEYWNQEDIQNNTEEYIMFRNISLMIANIFTLDSLSFLNLDSLLREYGNVLKLLNIDFDKTRFSISKLVSSDFDRDTEDIERFRRIKTIISNLEKEEIYIP